MNRPDGNSVRIALAGDVALGGEFLCRARPHGAPLTFPFAHLNGRLKKADVLVVNLEGPIGTEGVPRAGRSALLHNNPEVLDWLAEFPHSVCCLANNHMMDYGVDALVRTRMLLAERGIHSVGAGLNEREAARELRLKVNGLELGILAFTTDEPHVGSVLADPANPGSCGLPDARTACDRVSRLAEETDAVIVLLHWGFEYFNYPAPAQVALCRELAEAGATLVVGHHPHVQQSCETIGNALACYSLGNLLLPEMRAVNGRLQYRKPVTKQYGILHAQIAPHRVAAWNIEGGQCDRGYNLIPYSGRAANRFATTMDEISQPLKLTDYAGFWASYSARRKRALEREGLRDAAAKLLKSDFKTIWRTFSVADVRRNLRRLFTTALLSRGGTPADKVNRAAPR